MAGTRERGKGKKRGRVGRDEWRKKRGRIGRERGEE